MASFRERLGECPWTVSHPPSRQLVRSPEHPVGCEPCTCSALCGGGICEEAVSDLDVQADSAETVPEPRGTVWNAEEDISSLSSPPSRHVRRRGRLRCDWARDGHPD